jgi:hypothetical protein
VPTNTETPDARSPQSPPRPRRSLAQRRTCHTPRRRQTSSSPRLGHRDSWPRTPVAQASPGRGSWTPRTSFGEVSRTAAFAAKRASALQPSRRPLRTRRRSDPTLMDAHASLRKAGVRRSSDESTSASSVPSLSRLSAYGTQRIADHAWSAPAPQARSVHPIPRRRFPASGRRPQPPRRAAQGPPTRFGQWRPARALRWDSRCGPSPSTGAFRPAP